MCANLKAYQSKLDALLAEDSTAIFANYSRAHACCIVRTFLNGAQKSVDILAGDFGNAFYRQDAIRDAVLKAVANGARVRVISLGVDEDSRAYVRRLAETAKSIADEKGNNGALLFKFARVRPGAQVKHYLVVDDKRYRLEDYHADDSDTVHAEVCCNGIEKASVLKRTFGATWDRISNPC